MDKIYLDFPSYGTLDVVDIELDGSG